MRSHSMDYSQSSMNGRGNAKSSSASFSATSQTKRIMVYTARVEMMVPSVETDKKMDEIIEIVNKIGGYLKKKEGSEYLIVKIPVDQFESFLAKLEKRKEHLSTNITADDVTEQYYDIKTRLDNSRKLRDRFLKILERANQVDEILKVEKELGRILQEIELEEGKMNRLSSRINQSEIVITFRIPSDDTGREKTYRPGYLGYPFYYAWVGGKYVVKNIIWLFIREEEPTKK